MSENQVLTADQMRAAEQAIFDTGVSEFELMQRAAKGAAEWIRRVAAGRSVTVLCGPGNNGGDGYVIAHMLRKFGNAVEVVAPIEPKTDTAKRAKAFWNGEVLTSGGAASGEVLVDCLFGSGLSRSLSGEHALLLRDLAERHGTAIAVDLPSGVESDTGAILNERLPQFNVTLALGAWKFAHWSLPGRSRMGEVRLVPIGVQPVGSAAELVPKPKLQPPTADAHKYTRGLAGIVGGIMPGAATLAATAAQRAGAGYVKLLAEGHMSLDPGLVCDPAPLSHSVIDRRLSAILVGPGLGRDDGAMEKLETVLSSGAPVVLDADALVLLRPSSITGERKMLATPHDGELAALCRSFSVIAETRKDRAVALARMSGMVVLAKGPDTIVASPDGRVALAPPAPSWLSVAGSGDVLAGIAVSRMAAGVQPFEAACEAVWLHGEAAKLCGPAFSANDLAQSVASAYARCL